MEGSSTPEANGASISAAIASILGVKGLRFRPHGSSQKAHVVLRRVVEEDDSSDDGSVTRVVRFSLFAHKRIEVKPGKEILLTVATQDGSFKDTAVVFEGDLPGDESDSIEEEVTPAVKEEEEETYYPPLGHAIPPKMRRAWTKRIEEVISVAPQPAPRISVGVQVERSYESTSIQARQAYLSTSTQTDFLGVSVHTQVDPIPRPQSRTADRNAVQVPKDKYTQTEFERSPSPMELDSPNSSPLVPSAVIPLVEDESLSNFVLPSSSNSCHPILFSADKSIVMKDLQQRDTTIDTVAPSHAIPSPTTIPSSLETSSKRQRQEDEIHCMSIPAILNPTLSSNSDSAVHTVPSGAEAPSKTADGQTSSVKASALKETHKFCQTMKNAVASSSKIASDQPISNPNPPPIMPRGLRTFEALQGLSSRAQEKSPATVLPGSQSSAPSMAKPSEPRVNGGSLPPDPKALAYIVSGPSTNRLGIKPSSNSMIHRSQRAPPSAPKILKQATAAKKPVVVGTGWSAAKTSTGGSSSASVSSSSSSLSSVSSSPPLPTPPPTAHVSRVAVRTASLSQITAYSDSPSPPPPPEGDPPPKPPTPPPSTPPPPVSKWKRVAPDFTPTPNNVGPPAKHLPPASQPTLPATSNLPNSTSGMVNGQRTVSQDVPLKDRISQDFSTPKALPTQTPASSKRDLLTRLFDIPGATPVPPPATSTNTSANGNKVVPTAVPAPLTHPLPPKPVTAIHTGSTYRGTKRDRPISPEPDRKSRRRKRTFKWPTVDSNATISLQGEGNLGVRTIAFSADGSHFALSWYIMEVLVCEGADRTIRIWNNRTRSEIARLSHNAPIMATMWMDGDAGVITLGNDGMVSKWTRSGENHWKWAKILDAGVDDGTGDDPICLAYLKDRLAVSFPHLGVKVWVWCKGTWQPQRSIIRQGVTSIKFIDDGAAIIGGTREGVLWYCEIPNGTLRVYCFLKTRITSLDVSPTGLHLLAGQTTGDAQLVTIRKEEKKGTLDQNYTCKELDGESGNAFGPVFATKGQAILFANIEGCVLVWDRKKGAIVYGLEHDEDDWIQAVASFDGSPGRDGCLLTGTKQGQLSWWSQPVSAPQTTDAWVKVTNHKRSGQRRGRDEL
ncbi:uncharacterized protein LACBIDRAFT_293378 [Laccaria bicolor S238N-H82]|uniref:Predicted protein n=1 Tax=Laccaria bicolor (strain S238N-H82 / ATCC MYA-4686) TaxID=486041 RepID=B0D3C1_LACBS|nr:uncharacterized protein LACBIDRAFT_293378 [Laccaria bicolor S238N-H82]EDR10889.1 predicted protein [Laccaria bicolor S238N-H82]|eukprot:XP_001878190.1 predicted protein [Laccaria bicolor S238N-H82]